MVMTIAMTSSSPPDEVCATAAKHARALAAAAPVSAITAAVADAVSAIDRQVPGHLIHWPDGNGGAHVFIDSIDLGTPFAQPVTWVAFHIPNTFPTAISTLSGSVQTSPGSTAARLAKSTRPGRTSCTKTKPGSTSRP